MRETTGRTTELTVDTLFTIRACKQNRKLTFATIGTNCKFYSGRLAKKEVSQ